MTREEGEAIKARWERDLTTLTDRHWASAVGMKKLFIALAHEDDTLLDQLPSMGQVGVPAG